MGSYSLVEHSVVVCVLSPHFQEILRNVSVDACVDSAHYFVKKLLFLTGRFVHG